MDRGNGLIVVMDFLTGKQQRRNIGAAPAAAMLHRCRTVRASRAQARASLGVAANRDSARPHPALLVPRACRRPGRRRRRSAVVR